jgi:hypothetical protein
MMAADIPPFAKGGEGGFAADGVSPRIFKSPSIPREVERDTERYPLNKRSNMPKGY